MIEQTEVSQGIAILVQALYSEDQRGIDPGCTLTPPSKLRSNPGRFQS